MKKLFALLLTALITSPVFADTIRTGSWASSYTIAQAGSKNIDFAVELGTTTRDIAIANGSASLICVDLKGGTCNPFCNGGPTEVHIPATSSLSMTDFRTSSITICGSNASASPVSVVVSY